MIFSDREASYMTKEDCLLFIQIARQTRRIDDMLEFGKILAKREFLGVKEIAAIDSGFKLKTQFCIAALKKLNRKKQELEKNKIKQNSHILHGLIVKYKDDLFEICVEAIRVFTDLLKNSQNKTIVDSAFYRKLTGDYNRIMAEWKSQSEEKKKFYEQAEKCYNKTLSLLEQQMIFPKPIKIGAMINNSIVEYALHNSLERALNLAFEAEYEMSQYDLDEMPEVKAACQALIEINNRNLTLWRWEFENQYDAIKVKFDEEKDQLIKQRTAKQVMSGISNIFNDAHTPQPMTLIYKRQTLQQNNSFQENSEPEYEEENSYDN